MNDVRRFVIGFGALWFGVLLTHDLTVATGTVFAVLGVMNLIALMFSK